MFDDTTRAKSFNLFPGQFTLGLFLLLLLSLLLSASPAWAEQDEIQLGLRGGLLLPDFNPDNQTTFALATWSAGLFASYGVSDDWSLIAQVQASVFSGRAAGVRMSDEGLDYRGTLSFSARMVHVLTGLAYKLISGYDPALHLEANLGYLWTAYRRPRLLNDQHEMYDLDLSDFGQGALTASVGLVFDYRLADTVLLGLGAEFVWAFSKPLLRFAVVVPLTASYTF